MNYVKQKWLSENSYKSQLMGNGMLPMKPDIGSFIKVESIEIPEAIFKEEYDTIKAAYFSVIKKLDEHYKNLIQ